jgi:hypothetical protein
MYPYYDFIGVEDRWLPTKESLDNAMDGRFDACIVRFSGMSPFLVPWTRGKFLKELKKFTDRRVKEKEVDSEREVTVVGMTQDKLAKIFQGVKMGINDKGREEGTDREPD